MSWIEELYKTYESSINMQQEVTPSKNRVIKPLLPQYHQLQNSTLEVTVDSEGRFRNALLIKEKSDQKIIVPCTEQSAARTTNDCPHPLCDKIQYCAKDYEAYIYAWLDIIEKLGISKNMMVKDYLKNKNKSYYKSYCKQQNEWLDNSENEPMLETISCFVKNEKLIECLIMNNFVKDPVLAAIGLTINEADFDKIIGQDISTSNSFLGQLSMILNQQGYILSTDLKNKIFSYQSNKINLKEEDKTAFIFSIHLVESIEELADLFVRWKVEIPNNLETRCWKSKSLIDNWVKYNTDQEKADLICMVSGETKSIARTHPKGIIDNVTNAKLISANDSDGFTYRGRFLEDFQACTVSKEVSHKAHSALRWLISRQGFINGSQVIVSWAVSGQETPDLLSDTLSLFDETDEEKINEINQISYRDAGQTFARKLSKKIAGYKAELKDASKIVVMGLDSAGPGRVSITYYRELANSEFLERIEKWHTQMAWHFEKFIQDPIEKKKKHHANIAYAPSPVTIAEACYGTKRDKDFEKFKKSIIERFLPCIIDGRQIPIDMIETAVHRASNRLAYKDKEKWQWEQTLSVACALYRCYSIRNLNNKNEYTMALENERTDRDYLYGRLLAVAEYLEEKALYLAGENRITNAARLMQRFSDHPFQTWVYIEKSLDPYKTRLQVKRPKKLFFLKNQVDDIHNKFLPGDYEKEGRLSGLYLLGYHCQRLELLQKIDKEEKESEIENN